MPKKLSLKRQNYIEEIYELCQEEGHAHVKDIAEALGVRMPSVTEAIQSLAEAGLVHYDARKAITLTKEGQRIATELEKKHSVLREFFCLIGCKNAKADEIACRVEHTIDNELAQRLGRLTEYLQSHAAESEEFRAVLHGTEKKKK